jgi:hypothetical protein
MRLVIELLPHEELVLLKNQNRFNICNRDDAVGPLGQPEEIIEHTFADGADEGLREAAESRILAQFKSAEDAELVLTMYNIIQRAVQETRMR